jgi:hypothetical protein
MKYKEKAMVVIKDDFGTDAADTEQPSEDDSGSALDSQLEALLKVKASVDKSGVLKTWTRASGFNGGYCSWGDTVICDDQKNVVKLELDKKGLKGTLPSGDTLSKLPMLQAIFMAKNELSGTLPGDWGVLKQLELIYLNTNKLQGSYPEGWSGMQSLVGISIDFNNLKGGIPPSWCSRMPALEYLYLDVRGCIPRNCASRGITWNGYGKGSSQYQSWMC